MNTQRRDDYIDNHGNMFIPMNVEGGTWNEHFFTTTKLITLAAIIGILIFILAALSSETSPLGKYIFWLGIWGVASFYAIRYIIFEEKFYYKMYKELQQYEVSSPAVFWNIASIKDTDEGAILTYADGKIGVIVKIERDTITGKPAGFKETHYDAISDFYKEVNLDGYSLIQMNIMEQAGKDDRLNDLSKLVYSSDNPNICKLMEMEVGHIKNISHRSLYESDYFLFYTTDITRLDSILEDVNEKIFILLDGAFASFSILTSKNVVDLVKEIYGVNYFNSTQASLQIFSSNNIAYTSPFTIKGILWENEEDQELTNADQLKLKDFFLKYNNSDSVDYGAVEKLLYKKPEKKDISVDYDRLDNRARQTSKNVKPMRPLNTKRHNNQDDDEYIDI